MILADKIINLRKKAGLSQEELADKLGVSRQAVSKWESAQSVPDMNRILKMSELFNVTTDYLLKDELEDEQTLKDLSLSNGTDDADTNLIPVSLEEANAYLDAKEKSAMGIAIGVALCIVSPILMILLAAAAQTGRISLNENKVAFAGLSVLIVLVAIAVVFFVYYGMKLGKFSHISEEAIDTAYGVEGMVRERKQRFENHYTINMIIGVTLCVLSVLPIFICAVFGEKDDFIMCIGVALLLLLVAAGVFLIVKVSIVWSSFNALLEEGDYKRGTKKFNKKFGGIYWPIITAAYLLISFLTYRWDMTWIIWPIAGIIYGGLININNIRTK